MRIDRELLNEHPPLDEQAFLQHVSICDTCRAAIDHGKGERVIRRVKNDQGGFFKDTDVASVAADPDTRLFLLLVRMGSCRFLAAAQDVKHIIDALEKAGDHCRDVSIPAGH